MQANAKIDFNGGMNTLLNKIINTGINYEYPTHIARRVKPTNILALLYLFLAAIPFFIISLFYLPPITLLMPGTGMIVCITSLVLNRYGKIMSSRLILTIGPILCASGYNFILVSPDESPLSGVMLLQHSFSLIAFVVFDFREKKYLIGHGILSLILLTGFQFFAGFMTVEAELEIFRHGWIGVLTHIFGVLSGFASVYGLTLINIQSEKRLERFFQMNTDLFVIANFNGFFTKVNPAWSELLDYEETELVNKQFLSFVHQDDHQLSLNQMQYLRVGKSVSKLNVRFISKSGVIKTIQWNLFSDLTDRIIYASGRDITAQLKAEEMLRINERALISTSIGVVITDNSQRDNPIIYSNPANAAITGYASHEILGKNCRFLQGEDKEQEGVKQLKSAINNDSECKVVIRNYKKDGTLFWNELSISPVYDPDGKVTHYVGFQNDITSQVEAEKALQSSKEKLMLMNDELKDFAHIVSHDLKAPLRAISSLSQWIIQDYGDQLDDDGKAQFDLLSGRVKKMENLIEGILQYSRASSGNDDKENVQMQEIVDEVVEMLSPPEHIKINIKDTLPSLNVAKTRIQQVFQNIMSNAIKYNDKDEGMITISSIRENGHWVFSIGDNGPGIDQKHFDKVFQIFQTLGVKESYESTGIGLTIVKKTIELHGGEIWLESEMGCGTTFYFTLPAEEKVTSASKED